MEVLTVRCDRGLFFYLFAIGFSIGNLSCSYNPLDKVNTKENPGNSDTSNGCYQSGNSVHLNNTDSFGIVNGSEASGQFPEVVFLLRAKPTESGTKSFAICSGSFVGPNVLVTAAHCIDSSPNGGVFVLHGDQFNLSDFSQLQQLMENDGITAMKTIHQGLTESDLVNSDGSTKNAEKTYLDIAFLIFAKNVAQNSFKIIDQPSAGGDKATIAGFGYSTREENAQDSIAIKRKGNVEISSNIKESYGLITLSSSNPQNPRPETASTAHGDSGGPILKDNQLAGVSTSGAEAASGYGHISYFVDLNSKESRNLITRAKNAGAIFQELVNGSFISGSSTNSANLCN